MLGMMKSGRITSLPIVGFFLCWAGLGLAGAILLMFVEVPKVEMSGLCASAISSSEVSWLDLLPYSVW